jgi:hypothetical protein
MKLDIVHYNANCKDELEHLFNKISLQLFVGMIPDSLLFKKMGTKDYHYNENYIAARSEGKIVGILGYRDNPERDSAYLSTIEVFLKRKGIGTTLIEEFKNTIISSKATLHTYPGHSRKDRRGTRIFLERNGFKVDDYSSEDKHFIMSWCDPHNKK